jgi:hypothetical protein
MVSRQFRRENGPFGFVRVRIQAHTARPRPNVAGTKRKVAALFSPVRPDLLSVLPYFGMQSPRKHADPFWVAIITGITTQERLGNRREIESQAARRLSLDRKSARTGLPRADCTKNDDPTLRLIPAMLGLGRVAPLLTRASWRRCIARVKAVSKAEIHDPARGLRP